MNRETTIETSDNLVVIDQRKRRAWVIGAALLLGIVAIGIILFVTRDKPQSAAEKAGQATSVSVMVPGSHAVPRVITANGALAARRDQPVGVAGSGGRVTAVFVDAGSWVSAGQVLARVDRSVQAEQAAQLRASIAAAEAQAALAQSNYERAQSLVGRGFVSKADLDSKKAARDAANAQVRVARAQLGATQAQIGQLDVRAPTSGLVLQRSVEVGQIVGPGSGALFRIAAGGEVEMRAQMAQQDLAVIHPGTSASITPIGLDRSFAGTVWMVSPIIDPQSRQGEARIAVPYNPQLRPGGFAQAKISVGATTAPVLPQSAVLSDSKGNYVYVVGKENKAERRAITIGDVTDAGVIIAQGLTGNEKVVVSAGPFLNPGQKIAPKIVAPEAVMAAKAG